MSFPNLPAEVKAKILKNCDMVGNFSKTSKLDDEVYQHMCANQFKLHTWKDVYNRMCSIKYYYTILEGLHQIDDNFTRDFHDCVLNHDEDGYIEITATLVSDPSVQTSMWIPIEALRTRGLSLVGPSGLASSDGYGIPGYAAEAYVLIENLGNAVETTTSIDWTSPSWGGTPVLYDG